MTIDVSLRLTVNKAANTVTAEAWHPSHPGPAAVYVERRCDLSLTANIPGAELLAAKKALDKLYQGETS